jgi:uncharacterized protein (AIM24 family)
VLPNMAYYTIPDLVKNTAQEDKNMGVFELEKGDRFLEINLQGKIWTTMGAMVAYRGDIKFTREGMLEHGLGKFLKQAFTGEGMTLTKAEGGGKLYLSQFGKKITVIQLNGESICVNGNDILAFEDSVQWDVKMIRKIGGLAAGGLFNVTLSGHGMIAITTHFEPITLQVTSDSPVMTDPNATVAWSQNLSPDFKTDISFKTFLGRSSGESFQMKFSGEGFVVVQPYEEVYMAPNS